MNVWLLLASLVPIIFFHELSHLIVAKLCKCGVEIFSVGFGKPIFKKEFRGTTYQVTPWILGGFCKLSKELEVSNDPHAFSNLRYMKKVAIVLAGVAVNVLMGFGCMFLGRTIHNYPLWYFGYISLVLGLSNAIPFPVLDGSYPILVWLEKFYGKERGYAIMKKIVSVGFVILMVLNILCVPWLISMLFLK